MRTEPRHGTLSLSAEHAQRCSHMPTRAPRDSRCSPRTCGSCTSDSTSRPSRIRGPPPTRRAKPKKIRCPFCGRNVRVAKDGLFHAHNIQPKERCFGTYARP